MHHARLKKEEEKEINKERNTQAMQRQIVLRNIQMAILDHEGCKSNMESIQKVDVSFRVLFYMEIIIFEEVNRH
jgi:hypothetical protein